MLRLLNTQKNPPLLNRKKTKTTGFVEQQSIPRVLQQNMKRNKILNHVFYTVVLIV